MSPQLHVLLTVSLHTRVCAGVDFTLFKIFISAHNWKCECVFTKNQIHLCSYLSRVPSRCSIAKNSFCLAGKKEGEEALMKISADLCTFEIVLFKSSIACIHTYFISIALCMLREAMGIIYVVQEEREIKEKGEKERKKATDRSDIIQKKPHRTLRGAEAKEIRAQLIKHLNEVIKSVAFFIQLPLVKNN